MWATLIERDVLHSVHKFKPLKLDSLERQAICAVKGLKDFGYPCYKGPFSETMEMVNNGHSLDQILISGTVEVQCHCPLLIHERGRRF